GDRDVALARVTRTKAVNGGGRSRTHTRRDRNDEYQDRPHTTSRGAGGRSVKCEQVLDRLPDHTLGTLTDEDSAAVRAHLRGCAACRSDAESLDTGLLMFASAAHDVEPPPELEERVLSVLAEEWAADTPAIAG